MRMSLGVPQNQSRPTFEVALTEFRKRPVLTIMLMAAAVVVLAGPLITAVSAPSRSPTLPVTGGAVVGEVLSWAVFLSLAAAFAYLALCNARFRLNSEGVNEWSWRGWRPLRWPEVTRAYLERKGGGGFIVLCRGSETWRLPAAAFGAPDKVFDFVDARLPQSASRSADA